MDGYHKDDDKINPTSEQAFEAYRRAVEQHAIVAMTDRRGRITYANDLFCRISGYSREELIGSTHRLINSGLHRREFWREMWRTIASGGVWHGEICNRARDGSLYWVDSTVVPLRSGTGAIRGYMAIRHPITALKRARSMQDHLERRDAFKESVLNSLGYAVIGTGPDSLISVFNRGAQELLGYRASELIGIHPLSAICDPQELSGPSQELANLCSGGVAACEAEWIFTRKDGSRVPVHVSLSGISDEEGRFLGCLCVAHDISARRHAESALRESERKFRSLYHAAPLAIIRTRLQDGRLLEANPAFHAMTGYASADLTTLSLRDLCPHGSAEESARLLADLRRTGAYGPVELACRRKDGSRFEVLVNGMLTIASDSEEFLWSIAQDITRRKEMESELLRAAHLDRLTGLANRALLSEELTRAIRRTRHFPGHKFAVLYLDLDHFKTINDSLGHAAGDIVLQEVADRLRGTLRSADVVARSVSPSAARLGGDEFVVLLDNINNAEDATSVAARLVATISTPFQLSDRSLQLTTSIGIVTSEFGHMTAEEYLRDADTAMYEAKRSGRGRCAVFDTPMRDRVQRMILIESELNKALEGERFHLVFQPLVCLKTLQPRGCEALIRWPHPRLGAVSPSDFIPVAEDSGLILELGDWVLRTALAQFADWRNRYGSKAPESLNVNISRAQLLFGGLCSRIEELLGIFGLEPQQLHLEITETAVIHDPAAALGTIGALHLLGVKLALDDFGTGYSSLSSIHDLAIDVIKIDRSFVSNLQSGRVSAVIEAVVLLARQLGIELVAEGIETPEQVMRLRRLGCQLGQGYLFAMPMDAERFAQCFIERRWGAEAIASCAASALAEGVA